MWRNKLIFLLCVLFLLPLFFGFSQELPDDLKYAVLINNMIDAIDNNDFSKAKSYAEAIESSNFDMRPSFHYFRGVISQHFENLNSAEAHYNLFYNNGNYNEDENSLYQETNHRLSEVQLAKGDIAREIGSLQNDYDKKTLKLPVDLFSYIGTGVTGLFGGLTVTFILLSDNAYNNYLSTSITDEAVQYRSQTQTFDALKITTLTSALVFTGVSALFWTLKILSDPLEQQIHELELKLEG